jgi:hypothetical protein
MSNEVRDLLHNAAAKPSSAADVAGAWRRGRRMRAQRMAVSGLAVVAIVAIASLAAANVLPDDGKSVPPAATGTSAPGDCRTRTADEIPPWARSANPPSGVAHALSDDGNVAYFIFSDPMIAGHRTDRENKILWIVRQPRDGQPLKITATLPGSTLDPVHYSFPADSAPGEIYPSVVDVPAPGCWHLELAWNGHRSSVDLGYGASDEPVTTTTSTPATTTTTLPAVSGTTCRTEDLTLTISPGSGAAGSVGYDLEFRNHASTGSCTMTGYPGVSFLDAEGHQIGVPAVRNPGLSYTPVTVGPGATVYALLIVGNPDMRNCPVSTPRKIRVFPPNQTADIRLPVEGLRLCATSTSASSINPVVDHRSA